MRRKLWNMTFELAYPVLDFIERLLRQKGFNLRVLFALRRVILKRKCQLFLCDISVVMWWDASSKFGVVYESF